MKKGDLITCAKCKVEFRSLRDETEALAEAEKRFGKLAPNERVVICDNCHREFLKWLMTQN